jgi:hypothetical protein
MILPMCRKKESHKSTDRVHIFTNTPLPFILQYLKTNGGARRFPRIIIIAYKLVGRGINIVSADFGWHLTHMFYRPSPTTDVTTMIQSMRLCGIYKDNIPLDCYITKRHYEDMYKGYMLQEDIFQRLAAGEHREEEEMNEWMQRQSFFKEKIPMRRLYKNKRFEGRITTDRSEDTGMSMEEFNKMRCIVKMDARPLAIAPAAAIPEMDHKELARLTNDKNGMFKKWADPANQSAIARFMRDGLDPRKTYTKKEIIALWKEYSKDLSITPLLCINIGKSKGYGKILTKYNNNNYMIHPDLLKSYEKYF